MKGKYKIDAAMHALDLAIRVHGAIRTGEIPLKAFRKGYVLDSGGEQHVRPKDNLSKEALLEDAQNLQVIALGMSAMVVDDALNSVFGRKIPEDKSEIGKARRLVYMIRCAFAHSPVIPVWNIKAKYRNNTKITLVSGRVIQIALEALDGKAVSASDLGGIDSYMNLVQFCRDALESTGGNGV